MNEDTGASPGRSRRRRLRAVALAAVLAGTAVVAAGCGEGSHPAGSGASSPPELAQALDAYAHCMHGHGLPGLYVTRAPSSPNPGAALMIFHGFAIEGANLSSPGFQSAQNACQHLLPQGTPPTGAELHQQFISALKSARCMRFHGYRTGRTPR